MSNSGGSLVAKPFTKIRLIAAADDVIKQVDYLTSINKAHNLNPDVVTAIRNIGNNTVHLIGLTRNKIISVPNVPGLLGRFDALSDLKKVEFYKDFYDKDISIYVRLEKESGSLFYIWKDDIEVLIGERHRILFLNQYEYIIYKEKDVWEHIDDVKNSPSYGKTNFNPIGGHTSSNFLNVTDQSELTSNISNRLLKFDPTTPGLPQNMRDYSYIEHPKGHIIHFNLYVENPNIVANSNNTYEFANKVFKRIPKKTEINPNWSLNKIKEEHAYALSNKLKHNVLPSEAPRFGQSDLYRVTIYKSEFTDGTIVLIKQSNYEWQNGQLYRNYVSYIEIQ